MAKVLDRPEAPPASANETIYDRYARVCELLPDMRVELHDDRIVVTDMPTVKHSTVVWLLLKQLFALVGERGWLAWTGPKLFFGPQDDRYIPDLVIAPPEHRMWGEDHVYAEDTLLVVEVVSPSSSHDDHKLKPATCARGKVPLYLVIDTYEQRVRLLSDPGEKGYATETEAAFGEPLELPEPWRLTLDTTPFKGL
ncbi:Uma2 family endonuclease [Spongiactinospora sp. 9N601]|uniref:Uma2 family endonuclease n=1 Tax=Spongiactinospora sp. 9N601 TaxID=3375149 RepID=UPI0037B856EA